MDDLEARRAYKRNYMKKSREPFHSKYVCDLCGDKLPTEHGKLSHIGLMHKGVRAPLTTWAARIASGWKPPKKNRYATRKE